MKMGGGANIQTLLANSICQCGYHTEMFYKSLWYPQILSWVPGEYIRNIFLCITTELVCFGKLNWYNFKMLFAKYNVIVILVT